MGLEKWRCLRQARVEFEQRRCLSIYNLLESNFAQSQDDAIPSFKVRLLVSAAFCLGSYLVQPRESDAGPVTLLTCSLTLFADSYAMSQPMVISPSIFSFFYSYSVFFFFFFFFLIT